MELVSSDESGDSDIIKSMKNQLTEFGLNEDDLSKAEMKDLLKALNNSKSTATEDLLRHKVEDVPIEQNTLPERLMKRRYINVRDRRLPWCLLPSNISPAEKARILAVYIKFTSIHNYRQARLSPNFAMWPPPIHIVEEPIRVQPLRSTRSGRSVPIYSSFDDDSTDLDFVVTKTKRRKVLSTSDTSNMDGVYSNKVVSLKRKPSKDENTRPIKESKVIIGDSSNDDSVAGTSTSSKAAQDSLSHTKD